MPQESSRLTRAIKIKNPDAEDQFVALKIIDEISFRDLRFQEYVYTFNNNSAAARTVRVKEIGDGDKKLKVERIETLSVRDDKERFQQYIWEYLTEEPPRHLVTHDVKIYATDADGNKDESVWIKVRRIDKILVLDEKERFQETELELVWPSDEDYDYTGLGELYDQDPPYRIDPFQAIIDASWGGRHMMVIYYKAGKTNVAAIPMSSIAEPAISYSKELLETGSIFYGGWTQIKLSSDGTFVSSLIQTEQKTDAVTGDTYYRINAESFPAPLFYKYRVFNSNNTIHKSAAGSGQSATLLNGNASALWSSSGDMFTFSESGPSLMETGELGYNAAWVGPGGERHGLPLSGAISGSPTIISAAGAAALASAFPTPPSGQYRALSGYVESPAGSVETDDVIGTITTAGPSGGVIQQALGSVSMTGKLAMITQGGGIDILSEQSVTAESSVDYYFISPDNPFDERYSIDIKRGSVGGQSFSWSRTESSITGVSEEGELKSFVVYSFPPGINGTYFINEQNQTAASYTAHTPYGDIPGSFDGGLFHVSNGEHVMQGFRIDGYTKIYLDGVEYTNTIEGLLGVTVDDIYTILFDIKISDITSLR